MSFKWIHYKPRIAMRHGYWRVTWTFWGVIVPKIAHVPIEFRKSDEAIACHAFAERLNHARD